MEVTLSHIRLSLTVSEVQNYHQTPQVLATFPALILGYCQILTRDYLSYTMFYYYISRITIIITLKSYIHMKLLCPIPKFQKQLFQTTGVTPLEDTSAKKKHKTNK